MDGYKPQKKYDRQLCIGLLTGAGDDVVQAGLSGLGTKFDGLVYTEAGQNSESVMVRLGEFDQQDGEAGFMEADVEELAKAVKGQREVKKPLTAASRVYLSGHGNWASTRLGSWSAIAVANLLACCKLPSELLVSVLGCYSAGHHAEIEAEINKSFFAGVKDLINDTGLNSFAHNLHLALAANHDIYIRLRARCACVYVGNFKGRKLTTDINMSKEHFDQIADGPIPRELVENNHKQPGSKYEWYWGGFFGKSQKIKKCY